MPQFSYVAKNDIGATVKGVESAVTRDTLADQLANRGLYLVRASSSSLSGVHIEFLTRRDLVVFTSQLLPIVATGVPLLTGLEDLEE